MREAMPATAQFIDELRATFGAETITLAMREGLRDGTFAAIENGHVVGTPSAEAFGRLGLPVPDGAPHEDPGYPALPANFGARI